MSSRQGRAEDRDGGVAIAPLKFSDYAELWQEQTSPEELAVLQSRARTIERSASRRRLRDLALTITAVGIAALYLWHRHTSLQMKLAFAPLVLVMVWGMWRRHQITRAAWAIAVDHPCAFFETAIENARAELRLSTIACIGALPFFAISLWLVKIAQGADFGSLLRLPYGLSVASGAVLAVGFLGYLLFLRENRKLRTQLRRLEAMRREWEDQAALDRREGRGAGKGS